MSMDMWLPIGYEITKGIQNRRVLYSGTDWQICQIDSSDFVLLVMESLAFKWFNVGLLDKELMLPLTFGSKNIFFLTCSSQYTLAPVEKARGPHNKADAMSFAVSLLETRKIEKLSPIHDAIYVEKFSRLLPTWTVSSQKSDDIVLGRWLTGGVTISTTSFRRLSMLVGWMNPNHLKEVILAAGFDISNLNISHTLKRNHSAEKHLKDNHLEQNHGENQEEELSQRFTLPGRPKLEKFFNEHVIDIIYDPGRYETLGVSFPSPIVLHGPPGCGKTFAAERLIEFIDWPCLSIDSNSVGSPYIHETSKKISEVFDKAINMSPSVILIDEMESFLSDRRSAGTTGLYHVEEVAEFLRRIPEAIKNKILIIAMTNLIEVIDPAILRRGRFDHIVEVAMPTRQEVEDLIKSLLRKIPTDKEIDITPILDKLTGKPLSDSAYVVREAARLAARAGKSRLDNGSIVFALESLQSDKGRDSEYRPIGFTID